MERYLKSKYIPHLVPVVQKSIFRSFWKVVFRSSDQRCEANRLINLTALSIIYSRNKNYFNEIIKEEVDYYSDITAQGSQFEFFQAFIGTHPELFSLLSDKARVHLEATASKSLDDFAFAWFLSPSVDEHLETIKSRLTSDQHVLSPTAFERLLEAASEIGHESMVLDIAIVQFGLSRSFDKADKFFATLIGPNINRFSKTQLLELAKTIESNGQICGRGRAHVHHSAILPAINEKFGASFDFSMYPKFAETMGVQAAAPEDDIPF